MMKKTLLLLILFLLVLPLEARAQEGPTEGAACTTAGVMARAGGPEITSPNGGNWMICNGSIWVMAVNFTRSAASNLQVDYDSGTCTTAKSGRIRYNSATTAWDYCNGSAWSSFGRNAAGCNFWNEAPGYVCPDGSLFAGFSPDTYYTPIFTTRCDAGMVWSGSSCTGSRTTYTWGSSGSTRSTVNEVNGKANTTTLAAFGAAAHPAAYYCENLVENGRSDWYLPSISELYQFQINETALANLLTNGNYESATEYDATNFTVLNLTYGSIRNYPKGTAYNVRCIRRN